MMNYKKLKVVVFTDGRPGHEKQSFGIIRALESKTEVEVVTVSVPKGGVVQNLLSLLGLFLRIFHCKDDRFVGTDLFIGTGRHTHIPLLKAQKTYSGHAVSCMTPSFVLRSQFDICFVPSHDSVREGKNIVYTLGAPNALCDQKQHDDDTGLILIGGISSKQQWSTPITIQHVQKLLDLFPEKKWRISSSPRTPEQTVTALEEFVLDKNRVGFFHYKDTESGWVEKQYHFCRDVWVTADSISMVFEALSAGCRVGLLPVNWKTKNSKFQQNEDYLLDNEYVVSLSHSERKQSWLLKQKNFDEASRVASLMLEKWWKKN